MIMNFNVKTNEKELFKFYFKQKRRGYLCEGLSLNNGFCPKGKESGLFCGGSVLLWYSTGAKRPA